MLRLEAGRRARESALPPVPRACGAPSSALRYITSRGEAGKRRYINRELGSAAVQKYQKVR